MALEHSHTDATTRREFVRKTALAGMAATLVRPGLAQEEVPGRKIRLGVIGCGGRGSWLGGLFSGHGGYELVAAADYFQDRVNAFGGKYGIPAERRFTGLSCHEKLLAVDLDAVAIISPPFFHPAQATAATAAGRHVFLAKPIAVDAPGCLQIEKAGTEATTKGLTFLVDFQTRANAFYREAVKRVHDGAIGAFTFGEARYHTGALKPRGKGDTPEGRLRNWVFDIALSGDIITEQNIHSLDVMNWIMGKPPLHVVGTGGRKVRTQVGNAWDHFALLYQYADGVGVTFSSKQYRDGGSDAGIIADIFGTKGRIVTKYGGNVMILGQNSYRGGRTGDIYRGGAVANIAAFHTAIAAGDAANPTVKPSVQSNLITIMGRTAAYEKRLVTWKETLASTAVLEADLAGLGA